MRTMIYGTLSVAILCAGCASTGHASSTNDEQITSPVQARLSRYPELQSPNPVRVRTVDRVVYPTGHVPTPAQRDSAESAAHATSGVIQIMDSVSTGTGSGG
jgi:osmotically-inducible protein OsmY